MHIIFNFLFACVHEISANNLLHSCHVVNLRCSIFFLFFVIICGGWSYVHILFRISRPFFIYIFYFRYIYVYIYIYTIGIHIHICIYTIM